MSKRNRGGGTAGQVMIPAELFPEPDLMCMEAGDGWLSGDGIDAGARVIIDPARAVMAGDIALVTWDSPQGFREGQLGRARPAGDGGVVVESSNPAYPPNTLTPDRHPRVEGLVIGTAACWPWIWRRIPTAAEKEAGHGPARH